MEQQRLCMLVPCISAHQESALIPAFLLFKIACFIFQDTSTCEYLALPSLQTQDRPTREGKAEFHGKGIFNNICDNSSYRAPYNMWKWECELHCVGTVQALVTMFCCYSGHNVGALGSITAADFLNTYTLQITIIVSLIYALCRSLQLQHA